jgi:hypothetical protein
MKESTIIMLWMLLFLLLLTFWVDLRLRNLREEFLGHCAYIERAVISGQAGAGSTSPGPGFERVSWYADAALHPGNPPSSGHLADKPWEGAPQFYDDLIPTKKELDEAMKGVQLKEEPCHWDPTPPGGTSPSLPYNGPDAYDGSALYATFPPR